MFTENLEIAPVDREEVVHKVLKYIGHLPLVAQKIPEAMMSFGLINKPRAVDQLANIEQKSIEAVVPVKLYSSKALARYDNIVHAQQISSKPKYGRTIVAINIWISRKVSQRRLNNLVC